MANPRPLKGSCPSCRLPLSANINVSARKCPHCTMGHVPCACTSASSCPHFYGYVRCPSCSGNCTIVGRTCRNWEQHYLGDTCRICHETLFQEPEILTHTLCREDCLRGLVPCRCRSPRGCERCRRGWRTCGNCRGEPLVEWFACPNWRRHWLSGLGPNRGPEADPHRSSSSSTTSSSSYTPAAAAAAPRSSGSGSRPSGPPGTPDIIEITPDRRRGPSGPSGRRESSRSQTSRSASRPSERADAPEPERIIVREPRGPGRTR